MTGPNPLDNPDFANPYIAARNEWNERYGSYVRSAAAWRIVGIAGMTMAVIGFGYALYQST
nr:conjugal transfer protein TrbF [Agrobacterium rosae]